MNSDEIANIVKQIATGVLSSGAMAAYVDHNQAVAIAAGLAALVSVAWSIASHWNMKKVPETATVIPKDGGK